MPRLGPAERLATIALVGLSSLCFASTILVARASRRDRRELMAARDSLQASLERLTLIQSLLRGALTLTPEAVWEEMSKTLLKYFGCKRATIFQRNAKSRLVSRYAHGLQSPVKVQPGEGIAGSVAERQAAHVANDAYRDPLFSPVVDQLTGFKTANLLACTSRSKTTPCAPSRACLYWGGVVGRIYETQRPCFVLVGYCVIPATGRAYGDVEPEAYRRYDAPEQGGAFLPNALRARATWPRVRLRP